MSPPRVEGGGKASELTVDRVILAVGIVGNVEDIGLEGTGVNVDQDATSSSTNGCAPANPGVYAIGDLVGPPWLAHKAMHEGVICVERIAGLNDVHPLDVHNIPGCTYCRPQVASVGPDREGAREKPGTRSRSATSRSSATARRSRSASPRAWSRRCSTPRPASCWART